jgi:DNA segregation ATPase FtsK/SpoIIIE-like protein
LLKFQKGANLTVWQVLKRRSEFLTTHGLNVISVRAEPGLVAIAIAIARPSRRVLHLPDVWKSWNPECAHGNHELLIALREEDSTPLFLSPRSNAPHTLIAGSTGSGKSVLMQNIHDEFAEWMMTEDYADAVAKIVGRLGVKARAAGISLLFAAQRPDANVMPMQLRANLGNRLVLRVDGEGTSEIALGEKGAERLLGKGHLAAKLEGEPGIVFGQVPFVGSDFLARAVRALRSGSPTPPSTG